MTALWRRWQLWRADRWYRRAQRREDCWYGQRITPARDAELRERASDYARQVTR